MLVAAATAVALALGAPAAGAAKKKAKPGPIRVASATTSTTADNQTVTATATCPKGTSAVGGGFLAGTSTEGGSLSDLHLTSVSRRSGSRAWIVTAERLDGVTPGPSLPVTSEAYCRAKAGKIAEATGTTSLTPITVLPFATRAACPVGRGAFAGGFSSTGPAGGLARVLLRLSPFGVVGFEAINVALAPGALSFSTHAYCGSSSKPPKTRTASVAMATNDTVVSATTASCPGKLASFGGGFSGPSFQTGAVALPMVVESRRSGNGWRASALNLTVFPGQLNAVAICS